MPRYFCLTILGYRKPGMSEDNYHNHMINVSAPMTKDLMVKYGIQRWTQIHNSTATRKLVEQLIDPQMVNISDVDCFSQVVFRSVDDYKRMKQDPWYKEKLARDHGNFADTRKSLMTIGWVEEFVRDGKVVDGFSVSFEAPKRIAGGWEKTTLLLVAGTILGAGLGYLIL